MADKKGIGQAANGLWIQIMSMFNASTKAWRAEESDIRRSAQSASMDRQHAAAAATGPEEETVYM